MSTLCHFKSYPTALISCCPVVARLLSGHAFFKEVGSSDPSMELNLCSQVQLGKHGALAFWAKVGLEKKKTTILVECFKKVRKMVWIFIKMFAASGRQSLNHTSWNLGCVERSQATWSRSQCGLWNKKWRTCVDDERITFDYEEDHKLLIWLASISCYIMCC